MKPASFLRLLPVLLLCALVAGCGRPAYLLPVKDGKGVAKGSHVFWDQGGTGAAKAVGTVTAVEKGGEGEKPVLVRFDLEDEYRGTIRENVAGAVMSDTSVAQSAFVLLLGGVGEGKEPLKPGVAIQEAKPAASAAGYATTFFEWIRNARVEELKIVGGLLLLLLVLLKIVRKVFKFAVLLAILGAVAWCVLSLRGGWEEQKEQLAEGVSKTFEQASDWVARHADELRAGLSEAASAVGD